MVKDATQTPQIRCDPVGYCVGLGHGLPIWEPSDPVPERAMIDNLKMLLFTCECREKRKKGNENGRRKRSTMTQLIESMSIMLCLTQSLRQIKDSRVLMSLWKMDLAG